MSRQIVHVDYTYLIEPDDPCGTGNILFLNYLIGYSLPKNFSEQLPIYRPSFFLRSAFKPRPSSIARNRRRKDLVNVWRRSFFYLFNRWYYLIYLYIHNKSSCFYARVFFFFRTTVTTVRGFFRLAAISRAAGIARNCRPMSIRICTNSN